MIMETEIKPNDKRVRMLLFLMWIMLGLEIVSMISGYFQYDLLSAIKNGNDVTIEAANANDLREQVLGIVYIVAYVLTSVFFLMWFRRAYNNLHQKVDNLSFTEGWAVGSWFVPILNLIRPYQIMKELYVENKELLLQTDSYFSGLRTHKIGWWWGFWLASNAIGQVVFRFSLNAESLTELIDLTIINIISNVIGIVLALFTINVIRDLSDAEQVMFDHRL
jgi:hypothetical protein